MKLRMDESNDREASSSFALPRRNTFAEQLTQLKFDKEIGGGLKEPKTALLPISQRIRLDSMDEKAVSTHNDEGKATKRRIEIIGGKLFVEDQKNQGHMANFI